MDCNIHSGNEKTIEKEGHGLKIRAGGGSNPIASKVTKHGYHQTPARVCDPCQTKNKKGAGGWGCSPECFVPAEDKNKCKLIIDIYLIIQSL